MPPPICGTAAGDDRDRLGDDGRGRDHRGPARPRVSRSVPVGIQARRRVHVHLHAARRPGPGPVGAVRRAISAEEIGHLPPQPDDDSSPTPARSRQASSTTPSRTTRGRCTICCSRPAPAGSRSSCGNERMTSGSDAIVVDLAIPRATVTVYDPTSASRRSRPCTTSAPYRSRSPIIPSSSRCDVAVHR